MKLNKENLEKILLKINPKLTKYITQKKINLVRDGLLDSLMIIKLIHEIENKTKHKIKINKIDKNTFANIENILKICKK